MSDINLLHDALQQHGIPRPKRLIRTKNFTRWGDNYRYWAVLWHGGWVLGDFVTGFKQAVFNSDSSRDQKYQDQRYTSEVLRIAREAAERLSKEQMYKAAQKAESMLAAAAETSEHPYLTKKGISGWRCKVSQSGGLLIPLKDVCGKIWSVQLIKADLKDDKPKEFLVKGRVKGCFHTIGEFRDRILLCEG